MGLETANTINELVETWPLQSDKIRQGAGHLRTIKGALKRTFPNITTPVTATSEALNGLPPNFSAFVTELLKHVEAAGTIKIWDVTNKPIPEGWVPCDGRTVSGYGVVPDLRDRFIVASGTSLEPGTTGGSISKTTTPGGGHTPVIQGHALTEAENGPHKHLGAMVTCSGDDNAQLQANHWVEISGEQSLGKVNLPDFETSSSGSGVPHTHGADAVPDHTHDVSDVRPPYYAVLFIIKVVDFDFASIGEVIPV